MDKNSLRIFRLSALLAITAMMTACANAPENHSSAAPEPAPAINPQPLAEPAPLEVKATAPLRYEVVKGDTLWDISSRYLHIPWRWPELWEGNPQISNPHLIYPGDLLVLVYLDGKPHIQLHRNGKVIAGTSGRPEVRLSPRVRIENMERAIPTIPMDAIRPFLSRPRVSTQEELDAAPYIVASKEKHLISAVGNSVYVRGIESDAISNYAVMRPGEVYRNPDNPKDILGYEAIHLGDAELRAIDEVATFEITRSKLEILNGDRLLPGNEELAATSFMPRAPAHKLRGQIIAVPGGVSQIGQYQVVTINLGEEDGMQQGHVLAIHQRGERIRDPMRKGEGWVEIPHAQAGTLKPLEGEKVLDPKSDKEWVQLPDEPSGTLMVFRTFNRVSYGLVMKASRSMNVSDIVTNP